MFYYCVHWIRKTAGNKFAEILTCSVSVSIASELYKKAPMSQVLVKPSKSLPY